MQVLIYHNNPSPEYTALPFGGYEYWQVGAYYGHTVLRMDINQDGLDDLLVSAPTYSELDGYDEGIVFVYMNDVSLPGVRRWVRWEIAK